MCTIRKRKSRARGAILVAGAILATTVAVPADPGRPPVSIDEYESRTQRPADSYSAYVIRVHNLQRVLDPDLRVGERIESLRLVNRLRPGDATARKQFATLLVDPQTPGGLRDAILEYLLRADHPGLGTHVVKALPGLERDSPLRDAIFDWLARNPTPGILTEIVKIWAQEKVAGPDEPRFRNIVEKVTKLQWHRALLAGLNTPDFFARGSAIEILTARLDARGLRREITRIAPKTSAMEAMRAFAEQFDYVPAGARELVSTVAVFKTGSAMLRDAAVRNRQWGQDAGYRFNIRDFHLLGRLARDPLRKPLSRKELHVQLRQAVAGRRHIGAAAAGQSAGKTDNFVLQADELTVADLWNLYLLNEMLERPRVKLALRIMADRDRHDTRGAWGGLVVYEQGRATARLYPAAEESGGDDKRYAPSRRMRIDSRDALCRFVGHFERRSNARRAGPTAEELQDARDENYYGLVLTTTSGSEFCAHYYNPRGIVISLGRFSFEG